MLNFPQGKQEYPPGHASPFLQGRKWSKGLPGRCRHSPSHPGKEAVFPRQLLTFLQGKAATLHPRPLLPFLLGKEVVLPRQLLAFPRGKQAVLPRQLLTFLLGKEAILPRQLLILPLGKEVAIPRQVKQAIKLGQAGRASGILPGIGYPKLTGRIVLPPRQAALTPRKTTSHLPPNRLPQGSSNEVPNPKWVINLSSKPLTPAQRSVLAKGPNFAVTPKQPTNLEYITAIEAACTKLSQQDAEELRADINRVQRSSQPPNPT